jgi:transcriptional regulator with XRE-family HTH domain
MLAKLIKSRREELNLTQEELALAAKTTQATISRIESGEQVPTAPTLFNIIHALGIEPSALYEVTISKEQAKESPDADDK